MALDLGAWFSHHQSQRGRWSWWRFGAALLMRCPPTHQSGVLTQGQEDDLEVAAVVGRVHRDVGVAVVPEDQRAGALDRILHLWAQFNPPQDVSGQSGAVGDTLNTSKSD